MTRIFIDEYKKPTYLGNSRIFPANIGIVWKLLVVIGIQEYSVKSVFLAKHFFYNVTLTLNN